MNFQKISTLDIDETPDVVKENVVIPEKPVEKKIVDEGDAHKTGGEKMCSHEKELYAIMNQLRRRIDDLDKDNDVHRERIEYLIGLFKEQKMWK